jgi:hypothetical protein
MKHVQTLAICLAFAGVLGGATCSMAPVSVASLGAAGCEIGPILFTDFELVDVVTGGLTALSEDDVFIARNGDSLRVQGAFDATPAGNRNTYLRFVATAVAGFTLSSVAYGAGGSTPGGFSEAFLGHCLNAAYGGTPDASTCGTPGDTLHVFRNGGAVDLFSSTTFAGNPTTLGMLNHIHVQGDGNTGSALLSSLTITLEALAGPGAIPEPSSGLLALAGLAIVYVCRRRR